MYINTYLQTYCSFLLLRWITHISQPGTAEILQFTPGACTESHVLTQSLQQALCRVCRHQLLHTPAHQAHSPCLHKPFAHHCMPAQLLVQHVQTIYLSHPIFWMTEIWILLCSHYHNTGLMLCPVTNPNPLLPARFVDLNRISGGPHGCHTSKATGSHTPRGCRSRALRRNGSHLTGCLKRINVLSVLNRYIWMWALIWDAVWVSNR